LHTLYYPFGKSGYVTVLCVVDVSEKLLAPFFTATKKFVRNISVESEVASSTFLEKLINFIILVWWDMLKVVL
jgi:hypothetical protein